MKIKNVHPLFLNGLKTQLPPNGVIKSLVSETPVSSIIVAELDGHLVKKRLSKVDLSELLKNTTKEIEVSQGDTLRSVCKAFFLKFNIPALPNVDFEIPGGFVDFKGLNEITQRVVILDDSIGLFGEVDMVLINKNREGGDGAVLEIGMKEVRLKLALVSKEHSLKSGKVFTSDQLTVAFSKEVGRFITQLGFDNLTHSDLSTGRVTLDTDDGVSRICLVRLLDGRLLPIRYKSLELDKPDLS